ncbi:cytochrome P450 86B1-like [Benincasa hispida]|uniref:cytochrome P450 86B1-like n=1 Tax=Benincasa hispida TaxID=102211 RepID=UPI00190036B0|nr:cytochrome P450 86B1-like [Benincasa hispida]
MFSHACPFLHHKPMMDSGNLSSSSSPLPPPISVANFRLRPLLDVQILEISFALFVFLVIHVVRQKRRYDLPVWPLVGMLPALITAARGNIYEWITELLHRHKGTFQFRGPWLSSLHCVVTADPRNLEHLLKTKFSSYPKGSFFRDTVRDLLGDGIFGADDETWQRQRKVASIEFHSARFRQMTVDSLVELVHSRLEPVLENFAGRSEVVDLQDVLLRLTFDNVCMIAFGVDPGCLRGGLPEIPFAKAFEDATEVTVLRFITPTFIWKVMRYLNLGMEKKLKQSIKAVDEFAENVIQTRKREFYTAAQPQADDQRSDLLTVFMRLRDEQGRPFSDKFLRDICVNFILAGRDTSSVALSWFFWLLDQNPDVEHKILEEICRIVSEREEAKTRELRLDSLVFKPEEIKKMEYLHAAISEALRLYPSVPVDHKEVVEDDVFPDGTILKKGTKIIYAIYAMGRMEAIWGKDCCEFKPERWMRDGRFMSESAYRFTAFNGGPRLCLGKDFAYYQMKYVAASTISRYRVAVVTGHPVEPKLALTFYMKNGLKVNLIKREEGQIWKYMKLN